MKAQGASLAVLFAYLLILGGLFPLPVSALDASKTLTQYAHRIWGLEEGLFQPTIYSIVQTRDGFLWLGTQDSLIRFDGLHFREFQAGAASSIFQHSLIRALVEDRQGNLWVGSIGSGIARINSSGAVRHFTAKDGLPSDSVFCLAQGNGDEIWACTNRGLVSIQTDGRMRVFTTREGLPTNQIRSTCEAPDGTRWVAGLDFGLARFEGNRFESYANQALSAKANVTSLVCGKDGSIWAGTSSGLDRINGAHDRWFTTRDGLPDKEVASLAESADGSLWIGTNDGISRLRDGDIDVYRVQDGLSHSLVLSVYVDREGNLWAGTKDGLDQFTDTDVTPYTTTDGLISSNAGPVLEDGAGHLWVGTLDKGLSFYDGRRFHTLTTSNGLSSNTVLSLQLGSGGDLWVGTSKGLNRVRKGKVIASFDKRSGLSGDEIHALFADDGGALWVGTDKGLDLFDGSRFYSSSVLPRSDRSGVVALAGGNTAGLLASANTPAVYYLRSQVAGKYDLDVSHPVDCYYLDPARQTVWMGTLGSGLLRWKNGALAHVRVKDGLYDNRIYSILQDGASNFWLASSKGIFRLSQQELEDFADGKASRVTSIPFSTGQLRFECRSGVQPAACKTRDGRLWFATTSGVVVIDPNHLRRNPIPPPVAVTAVLANGQRMLPSESLRLKPWEKNNVEIHYAALTFVSPEKATFRYRLQGFDKGWTDAGSRREAFYTNLPPGNFRFEVVARNADDVTSVQPATLSFTVEPRFYQRTWFFPAMAALLVFLIFLGDKMRTRRLQTGFQLVLAERSRIARELHDTLLQGLSGLTMQLQAVWTRLPPSKEKTFLREIILEAGRCSSEARQSLWGLRNAGPTSKDFSSKLAELARQMTSGTGLALSLDLSPVHLDGMPDAQYQLLRIAQEAISNSLKHAAAKVLRVKLWAGKRQLRLDIEDNGTGFDDVIQRELGHFGVTGMRERAGEIGADLVIVSSPKNGTKVSVSFDFAKLKHAASNSDTAFEHQI